MENLEIVQRWYATGNPSLLSNDIRWSVLATFPAGGDYHGRSAVLDDFFPKLRAQFDAYQPEPQAFFSDGNSVIVFGRYLATGAGGGPPADVAFAHRWTLADGQISALDQVADTAAMAATLNS